MFKKAFKLAIKETLTGIGKIHLIAIALFIIPFTIFVINNNLVMSIIWFVGAFINIPFYTNLICNYEKISKKQYK